MAIEKKHKRKIEVVGEEQYRTFQVLEYSELIEDGVKIGKTPDHRYAIVPGRIDINGVYERVDLNAYPAEVRNIASTCWTNDSYEAHEAFLRERRSNNANTNLPA